MRFTLPRFQSNTGAVGVSFDDDVVRLVQIREQGGGLAVVGAAQRESDAEGVDPERLATVLRDAIVSGGFVGRRCIISLPERDVFLQSMQLPAMSDAELGEAVAWESSQRMGVARDAIQSDWIRTGADDVQASTRSEVLAIAVRRSVLDMKLEALMSAGLRPMAVDTHFGGISRLFSRHHRRDVDQDTSRAVLHVGEHASTMLVLRGESIAFCKRIETGGRTFDDTVADRLCLEPRAAGELRLARLRQDASDIDPATDRALREAIRPVTAELAHQVLLCLRYASVTFRGLTPHRLISTGKHGHEPALLEALESTCGVPVHVDDAQGSLADLRTGLTSALQRDAGMIGAWAAVAGLSLRGVQSSRRSRRAAARPGKAVA